MKEAIRNRGAHMTLRRIAQINRLARELSTHYGRVCMCVFDEAAFPTVGATAKALNYSSTALTRNLLDGEVSVDGTYVENLIRQWANGARRMSLRGRCDSECAAILMSFAQSEKMDGHDHGPTLTMSQPACPRN